jgi:hypothetical protein
VKAAQSSFFAQTVPLPGGKTSHAERVGKAPPQATDVYSMVTAFVAVLEWWNTQ